MLFLPVSAVVATHPAGVVALGTGQVAKEALPLASRAVTCLALEQLLGALLTFHGVAFFMVVMNAL